MNFTGNQFPVTARRVDIGNGLQQKLGIGVTRAGEQLLRVALLHDAAKIHDRDAIRHVANHAHVMTDEQIGQPQLVWRRRIRFSTCACTDTSSADVGSSQTRNSGSLAKARAMEMR